jgi:MoaA/NifB/PqqE/SkfB family radical SAM enzyme
MSINELSVLFQKITVPRLINVFKLYLGFVISRIAQRPIMFGDPFAVSIEPTTVCNLHCPECPTGLGILKRSGGTMSDQTFNSLINGLSPNTFYINLYLQGEPFINPKILKWVQLLSTKKLFSVVSTNAQFIDRETAMAIVDSGLSKIIIGMDGITQESYSKYRQGGSVDKVYQAIECIIDARKILNSKTPVVVVQFIVFKHNENELKQLTQIKEKGVDEISIKTAQFIAGTHAAVHPPAEKKLTRYVPKSGKQAVKTTLYNHCWRISSSMVFSWEGMSYPCCFDKDGDYPISYKTEKAVSDIWKSTKFNDFRKIVLQKRCSITMCQNCTEGQKWWI